MLVLHPQGDSARASHLTLDCNPCRLTSCDCHNVTVLQGAEKKAYSLGHHSLEETTSTDNPGGGGSGGGSGSDDHVIPDAVSDIDGNSYDAVQIGNQVWMAENLRTTKYADGTTIPMGNTWSYTEPYRYAPGPNQSNEENMDNVARYGYLYNWPAAMHGASSSEANPSGVQGICPNGWHVPSDAEWTELTNYMKTQPAYVASGGVGHLARALAATWGWNSSSGTDVPGNDPSTNNATGFSALPAGYCNYGYYGNLGNYAEFWSATEGDEDRAFCRKLLYNSANVNMNYCHKVEGISVRCVRE